MDVQAEKKKLRKLRKQRRQAAKRCETVKPKKWLSNLAETDLPKIRRLFDPIVSLPKASGRFTVDQQIADGIVGLYVEG